jgi:hypothetical protein
MAEAPCIRLYGQTNMGVSGARNAGLRLVPPAAELVTFLDSDDVSPAGRFAADLALFRADTSLDLTYGLITVVDRIDEETLAPSPGAPRITVRGIQLSAAILRHGTIDRLGGFDEDFAQGEDTDLLFRLFEQRPRFVLSDTIAIYYRRHAGNLTNDQPLVRREFLKAISRSAQRRRRDPSLGNMPFSFEPAVYDLSSRRDPQSRTQALGMASTEISA